MNKFWNIKNEDKESQIDLFGFVGGSKEWNDGFNEEDFLNELRAIPAENSLNISINSFGGSVFTALSIYSLLCSHKGAITFRVDGAAMSAATIITSVPNAKVIMPSGAMMMIHKVSSIAEGNADTFRKAADDMQKLEENIVSIYAKKTGKKCEEIQEYVNAETYFTAEEAVEFGLADIVDKCKKVKNQAFGDEIIFNGIKVKAEMFRNAPKGFFVEGKAPIVWGENSQNEGGKKTMTIDELKSGFPEVYEAIRNDGFQAGIKQERERIKAIEEIAVGHNEMVHSAKFENAITAEQLAVAILKADKARNSIELEKRDKDAQELEAIAGAGNLGINPDEEKKNAEAEELKSIISAGARAFAKNK